MLAQRVLCNFDYASSGYNRRQTTEHCEHKEGEHSHRTKTIVEPEKTTSSAQTVKQKKSKQPFLTIKEMKDSKQNYQVSRFKTTFPAPSFLFVCLFLF